MTQISWGSSEERYRRLCMMLLVERYFYYVLARPRIPDAEYDQRERELLQLELARGDRHPRSPTAVPGSDRAADYPQSLRWYVHQHLKEPFPKEGDKKKHDRRHR